MKTEPQRTCPSCGSDLSEAMEFCPVCMLRTGLAGGVQSGESSSEEAATPTPVQSLLRFEHYELVTREDGQPVQLGRGAMGVTYKAFDVDLRCPVTLKVISEKYLGEESARLRFLREARAAASVRHTNVASVFHLGRTGGSYFYAMEFVEGETLENLIKRSGRLDVKLALEITTQVASGLAAVHEQNDAKGWYVSLSRARDAMHVFTRNKAALRQSVMLPGERKSVWELVQAVQRSNSQLRHAMMPDLWARQAEIDRAMGMER
jgi:hypothetical protein